MLNKRQRNQKIFIRVDGGQKLGLGHVMRGINLAKSLRKESGFKIVFLFKGNSLVKKLLDESGFSYLALNGENEELKLYSKRDVFITDSPSLNSFYLKQIKDKVGLLVSVYYGGKRMHYPVDVLINPNLNQSKVSMNAGTKYCGGGKYAILGEKYVSLFKKRKEISRQVKKILICFGGSDPNDITLRLVKILGRKEFSDLNVYVVAGQGYACLESLKQAIGQARNMKLKIAVRDISALMRRVDLAILSGGVLMHEAGVLGVPSIILCHNAEQNAEARAFHGYGMAFNLGVHDKVPDKKIIEVLNGLRRNKKARRKMSNNAHRHLDACGAARIASLIKSEMEKQ